MPMTLFDDNGRVFQYTSLHFAYMQNEYGFGRKKFMSLLNIWRIQLICRWDFEKFDDLFK